MYTVVLEASVMYLYTVVLDASVHLFLFECLDVL